MDAQRVGDGTGVAHPGFALTVRDALASALHDMLGSSTLIPKKEC